MNENIKAELKLTVQQFLRFQLAAYRLGIEIGFLTGIPRWQLKFIHNQLAKQMLNDPINNKPLIQMEFNDELYNEYEEKTKGASFELADDVVCHIVSAVYAETLTPIKQISKSWEVYLKKVVGASLIFYPIFKDESQNNNS